MKSTIQVGQRVRVGEQFGVCIEADHELGIGGVRFDDGTRRWGAIEQIEPLIDHKKAEELLAVLREVSHHNDALKPQFQFPELLMRRVNRAINCATSGD